MNQSAIELPVFETIRNAWEKVKSSKAAIWAMLICIIPIEFLIQTFDKMINKSFKSEEFVYGIVFIIIATILLRIVKLVFACGLIYVGVQRAMDLPIRFNMIKKVCNKTIILRMIGLAIIKVLVILPAAFFIFFPAVFSTNASLFLSLLKAVSFIIGLILCFYAIFIYIRISLSSVLVVTQDTGPWDAIKISFNATQSNVWRLIGLSVMNLLIVTASAIPLGIGLIWSLPYAIITYGVVYRKLILAK